MASSVRIVELGGLAEHGDISDWLDAGGSRSDLETVVEQTGPFRQSELFDPVVLDRDDDDDEDTGPDLELPPDSDKTPPPDRPTPSPDQGTPKPPPLWDDVRLSDWAEREIPPRQWIMEDWIPIGQCVGLYGVGGVRKTDWLLQLLMAASLGLPFCGIPLMHCLTYGLFCEDTEDELVRRAHRIAGFYGRSLAEFTGFKFASLVGVGDTEFVNFDNARMTLLPAYNLFVERIAEHGAKLAVLDTAPDFFGGEEISRRQVSRFFRLLDGIGMKHHCGLVYSAHPSVRGRASGTFASGTTGWEAKTCARLVIRDPIEDEDDENGTSRVARKPSDRRILTRAKSNYAAQGIEIELVYRDGGFLPAGIDRTTTPMRGQMRNLAADTKFLELLRKINSQGRYVHDASNTPDRYAPNVFYTDPDRAGFSKLEFTRAMARLFDAGRIKLEHAGNAHRGHAQIIEA
jgi:RecA-family ATPase